MTDFQPYFQIFYFRSVTCQARIYIIKSAGNAPQLTQFSVDDRAVIDEKYEGSHFLVSSHSTIVLLGADRQY